jgi:hypothetical protein
MSGVVERVIEDWLIKADERSYQMSFAAYLSKVGHTIRYVSRHSTLEHGKDLVTTKGREIHAYQLKAGNIDKGGWRSIREEVREAAIVPIEIPGLPRRVPDHAYLVLTGYVSDGVQNEISLINDDHASKNYATIHIIDLASLVAAFVSVFDSFLPRSIQLFHELVHLYLRDGREPCDKPVLDKALTSVLGAFPKKRPAGRSFSDLVVATEFSSASMRRSENFVGVIDAWVITACQILRAARSGKLAPKTWRPSFDRCAEVIEEAADGLAAEAAKRVDFLDDSSLLDGAVLQYRRTIVLGYLGARINSRFIQGDDVREESADLLTVALRERPCGVWSEGSWNYRVNLALALGRTPLGQRVAERLVVDWLDHGCPEKKPFLADPYSSVLDALSLKHAFFVQTGRETREERVSYTADAAAGYLARRTLRQTLASRWPRFSRFQLASMKPPRSWDELAWHNDAGRVEVETLPLTGSWAAMQKRAASQRSKLFGDDELWLLPYFLCAYPHRTAPGLSGELDYRLSEREASRLR